MKSRSQLAIVRRTLLPGILFWRMVSLAGEVTVLTTRDTAVDSPHVRDSNERDYSPGFLADRLGLAGRSTKFVGLPVRDRAGRKLGKLQDYTLDLTTGRILCVQVAANDPANPVLVPAKSFRAFETGAALLDLEKPDLSAAPHCAANADATTFLNSLRQSFAFFNQKSVADANLAPEQFAKSSELIGDKVRNKSGESLGKVVELIADVPTARVVFAVVNFGGSTNDLYIVPPSALQLVTGERSLLLDADPAKVASLAHSDGFFWSSLADPVAGVAAYHNFGQMADFEIGAESAKEEVRGKVEAPPVAQKSDQEIDRDIVMAMMHDDVNNTILYKNVRIYTIHGQVVLTGRVKIDKQKTKLTAIVVGVVGAANVRDEVEVK